MGKLNENIVAIKVLATLNTLEEHHQNKPIALKTIVLLILGLASSVKDFEDEDFITEENEEKTLRKESGTAYLVDRLMDAFSNGNIREQYLEELKKEEKYELLNKIT